MHALQTVLLAVLCSAPDAGQINPTPRTLLPEALHGWSFDRGDEGWAAEHDCTVSAGGGVLRVRSTGNDPYLHHAVDLPGGNLLLKIKARCRTAGGGEVFWTTDQSPRRGQDKAAQFALRHDGRWHEYSVGFHARGRLTDLRIDPGSAPGDVEIDSIRLFRQRVHPLTIESVEVYSRRVRFTVKNRGSGPLEFSAGDQPRTLDSGTIVRIDRPIHRCRPLEPVSIELRAKDLPPVRRTVFLHHADLETDWIVRPLGDFSLRIARDGSMARVERQGLRVAILAPLVHHDGKLPKLKLVDHGPMLRFQGEAVTVAVSVAGKEISVSIDGRQPCEGPVVRAIGGLEQGLFAGLEYLGKGEDSSSKLDVETAEHLRFAPDPLKVTMPLMAVVTDRASVAITWTDMRLQPVFAAPNSFDIDADHRMSLRGKKIGATIRADRVALEETILWAVKKQGLPPLPKPPRTRDQQWKLCLAALDGPLKSDAGWGHCAEARWKRHPFADMASTIWRLTRKATEFPRLVPGGAHVQNGTIYFVTGRAQEWLDHKSREVAGILKQQQPDGSFHYDGKYRRGHFENTASGVCARPAAILLDYARLTGDRTALEAGVRTLEYMKRFRTPRGAQVWEVPLHTPDLLASAYLVWAYVRGYELTGKREYLACARKWALSGVPFVYLWSRYPVMLYATPPVYGATNWRHCWFGRPVQWVGGVYAYALTMLAPHDASLQWNHLARGILISAEQQQYPHGQWAGLLPDVFELQAQQRLPARINPCALVSLRQVLDGELDFLCVATDGQHRIAAPFPVTVRDGAAQIRAKAGTKYQVIIDGSRIVEVKSRGEDMLPLR